jgi:glycosyltransferase involved in cell wall biosynthesis
MRVLFTIPNFDTAGSGKALLKLATRLDRAEFEPHICCQHDRGAFFAEVRLSKLPVHIVQYTAPMRPIIAGLRSCLRTSRFFSKFDLIHSFHYADDYSEPLAARMAGVKWIYVKKNMSWGSRAWRLRTRLAHGVIAQNTDMLHQFFPSRATVSLIPRGVDIEEFQPRPPATHLVDELGIRAGVPVVLAVANLVPVKGIEYLIDAFARVADTHTEACLLIVGDDAGEYGQRLRRQAASCVAASRIVFTGKRPDVAAFQSLATVFVLPTLATGRQEGSPVSLLEAIASGTLVIATDVSGIRDQMSELPGQLVAPGDADALAAKLDWALRLDVTQRSALLALQRKIVEERFTIDREVAAHERFYRQVFRGPR